MHGFRWQFGQRTTDVETTGGDRISIGNPKDTTWPTMTVPRPPGRTSCVLWGQSFFHVSFTDLQRHFTVNQCVSTFHEVRIFLWFKRGSFADHWLLHTTYLGIYKYCLLHWNKAETVSETGLETHRYGFLQCFVPGCSRTKIFPR